MRSDSCQFVSCYSLYVQVNNNKNKDNMINCLVEQVSKRDDTFLSYKNEVYNLQQKLIDLHTTQSSSYKSIDNHDFLNREEMEMTIKAIKIERTNELVISSHKNVNNDNNSKIVENNTVESDINTTGIIVDDTNKIIDTEKIKIKRGKQVAIKKKKFILGDSI